MIKLRAIFEKKGRAKYISHLDLNRCMLRIFRRSGLPIWYTEGFNPHPYFSFALALSLGFESSCEVLDFNLNEDMPFDEVMNRLNAVMPEGMRILAVGEPRLKITEIAGAEYSVSLETENPEKLRTEMEKLLSGESILIEKKTKKGIKTVDLKPSVELLSMTAEESELRLILRLPAGTQTNFNPMLLIEALKNTSETPFEVRRIVRLGILCENNEIFS
ncbi:MAG: TIGR03936 family radical SAM-associated protein [Ruminococcus sp.]